MRQKMHSPEENVNWQTGFTVKVVASAQRRRRRRLSVRNFVLNPQILWTSILMVVIMSISSLDARGIGNFSNFICQLAVDWVRAPPPPPSPIRSGQVHYEFIFWHAHARALGVKVVDLLYNEAKWGDSTGGQVVGLRLCRGARPEKKRVCIEPHNDSC